MSLDLISVLVFLGGYILGSIPFGLLIAHAAGQGDIRAIGSGNIGATNVLRTGRKDLAIVTLLLDAAKAGVAVLVVTHLFNKELGLLAGGAALIGHCFPIWLKFRGGKGVATFFGFLFASAWQVGLIAGAVWLLSAFMTRMSSLSALLAAVAAPISAYFLGYKSAAIAALILSVVIFVRHRENIARILDGSESKIGKKGKSQTL
ncbi:MAG: glycerol-3-phosphate 1-O-acyltransferase PlsY [Hyphomonadaceae bacterium]|nr:glycerol-3-phosphate 1-O-acyltransferase PlsY [Hyphomonadaceae bacterium]